MAKTVINNFQDVALASNWQLPAPIGKTIHIWQADFSKWQPHLSMLVMNLSQEERQCLQRFRDPVLANRYIIGRGLLRVFLERYQGIAAARIQIITNAYGKPKLWANSDASLRFNLAHTEDMVLYGFSNCYSIGIDVEQVDPSFVSQFEAQRILTNIEWTLWKSLSDKDRISAFFQTWVRKEAALKALGVGFSIEPDTFSVGFAPNPTITDLQGTSVCVCDLSLNAGVKAAVALTNSEMPHIHCFIANAHL
jgi:4'-phosphopantetheinyl transferase